MTCCGLCQNFTLDFSEIFSIKPEDKKYYRQAGLGRCKLEPVSKVRAPNSGKECGKYSEAADKEKRIEWMRRRK